VLEYELFKWPSQPLLAGAFHGHRLQSSLRLSPLWLVERRWTCASSSATWPWRKVRNLATKARRCPGCGVSADYLAHQVVTGVVRSLDETIPIALYLLGVGDELLDLCAPRDQIIEAGAPAADLWSSTR
jgi:hypothetical protein